MKEWILTILLVLIVPIYYIRFYPILMGILDPYIYKTAYDICVDKHKSDDCSSWARQKADQYE